MYWKPWCLGDLPFKERTKDQNWQLSHHVFLCRRPQRHRLRRRFGAVGRRALRFQRDDGGDAAPSGAAEEKAQGAEEQQGSPEEQQKWLV